MTEYLSYTQTRGFRSFRLPEALWRGPEEAYGVWLKRLGYDQVMPIWEMGTDSAVVVRAWTSKQSAPMAYLVEINTDDLYTELVFVRSMAHLMALRLQLCSMLLPEVLRMLQLVVESAPGAKAEGWKAVQDAVKPPIKAKAEDTDL